MRIKVLLLPFKWFIIGVEEVLVGIFNVFKSIGLAIKSLFKGLGKGLILIGKGIVFFFSKIIFEYLILSIYKAIKFVILNILKFIKILFLSIYRFIKFIILGLFKLIKLFFKYLFIVIKFLFTYLYKAIGYIFKYLFIVLKYIFTYLYKAVYYIFKYLFIVLKYIFRFIVKSFGYLIEGLVVLITQIAKILKIVFVDFIIKYLIMFFKGILDLIVKLLVFLSKIPIYTWNGIKTLFNMIGNAFSKLFEGIKETSKGTFDAVGDFFKKAGEGIKNLPKNVREKSIAWFNNLSFVKDIQNKKEMKRQALLIDFDAEDAARTETKVNYRYVAKNLSSGKIEKGVLGAYSKLDVHSYLLAEGYEVYEIEPAKGIILKRTIGHKMKTSELVFFLTQLSTYIKAGIPLVDSIKILGKQAKGANTRSLYKALIYDLTMGDNFSEALEKQTVAFPRLLVNMVKSSELAGNLTETLDDMVEYYTAISRTKKQMKSAMTYPTVIFVFATGVVVFLLTFVIPSFLDMYRDADAEVPALTMAIINASDFLVNNAILLIIGIAALITAFYFMYKNVKLFRSLIQWILMHLPIVGKIIIYNEVSNFSKTFASLWNHNVFITQSMEILSKITNNEVYKMLIFDAITNVARGDPVSSSFKNHWAFPVVAYEMLVTGERTGQPGPMMDKVADYYQEEHKNAINQVKTFIEPAMIVFLAVVVGVILLAVILPMFNIYSQISYE
jgi:type IV pilus assembly protein PilC